MKKVFSLFFGSRSAHRAEDNLTADLEAARRRLVQAQGNFIDAVNKVVADNERMRQSHIPRSQPIQRPRRH
jgi:hypothetical protein